MLPSHPGIALGPRTASNTYHRLEYQQLSYVPGSMRKPTNQA